MPTIVHRFARFAVVGVMATATHVAVFTVALEWGRLPAVAANAAAFSVAVLVGYALNRRWTFASHGGGDAKLWRYVVAALAGLGGNSLVMFGAVDVAGWSPYVGLVLALMVMPPLSFALNQFWVFRAHR